MWIEQLKKRLESSQQQHLQRVRHVITSHAGIEAHINGKKYISFSSNDYLSLSHHPDVITALKNGAEQYGVGSSSSALIAGHSISHKKTEDAFAEFLQRDRALFYSCGYMANLGVISSVVDKNTVIFGDKFNHASLIDAAKLSSAKFCRYAHRNTQHLKLLLEKNPAQFKLIVSDGIFSMEGNMAPLSELATLAKESEALLMIDDAHGIGNFGQGRGIVLHHHLNQESAPILSFSLGKAFGCFGAIVAGSSALIENLIHFSRSYIYTTAISPALACAALASLKIVQSENWRREKLMHLIHYFQVAAQERQLAIVSSPSAIQALIFRKPEKALVASQHLFSRGFLVNAIRPPTVPVNTSRLRIILTCMHTEKHIDDLLDILYEKTYFQKF